MTTRSLASRGPLGDSRLLLAPWYRGHVSIILWNEREAFIDQRGCRIELAGNDRCRNELLVLREKLVCKGMQCEL